MIIIGKMKSKYLVKIRTDGSHDNIFFEAETIDEAKRKSGVTDMKPYQELEVLGRKTIFYKNGVQITFL